MTQKCRSIIDTQSRLHHDQEHNLALTCPHCQVLAHITPMAVPNYDQLVAVRPTHAGLVFRCDSCNAPVFLKFMIKMYAANRVELSSTYIELEHAREKFTFTYMPEEAELLFKEALACYSAGCFNAFASMCRRTAQAVFADLGEGGKLKLFDELNEIRELAEIESGNFHHRQARDLRHRQRESAQRVARDRAVLRPACCSK